MANDTDLGLYTNAPTEQLFGILKFDPPLNCKPDLLGQEFPVSVGDSVGVLKLPASPEKLEGLNDPLREPLVPPIEATTWKHGDHPMFWGLRFANKYPSGDPNIHRALFIFEIRKEDRYQTCSRIHDALTDWQRKFYDLLDLLSRRCLEGPAGLVIPHDLKNINLFTLPPNQNSFERFVPQSSGTVIDFSNWKPITPNVKHFRDACSLASSDGFVIPIAHQFQLSAHRAFQNEDYRKSIIETAVATEIAPTELTEQRLAEDGISYSKAILGKFKMLSGRMSLAHAMGIALPQALKDHLVNPRNLVAHQGHKPYPDEALRAIDVTDELLRTHFPLVP